MEKLKEQYEEICNEYKNKFIARYFYFNDGSKAENEWIANEVGGILEVNDYYFNFEEIRLCIDNNYQWEDISQWYDYVSRVKLIDVNIPTPNLKSWIQHCPRLFEQELQELESAKKRMLMAKKLFEKAVEETIGYEKK